MKKCPFCAEEIQDLAIKCRYCQSDLTGKQNEPAGKRIGFSESARDVAQGLKKKEYDDFWMGAKMLVILIFAIVMGNICRSVLWGFISFIVPASFVANKYYKR
jgi:hypothetical protein